jgi:hypothetical protein
MMKYVDGHRRIEFPIPERQVRSVKFANRYRRSGSNQHIDSFNPEIGARVEKCLGKQAISAPDVEDAPRPWQQRSDC